MVDGIRGLTEATFKLEDVPAGAEGEIEKALDAFYIRGYVRSVGFKGAGLIPD